MAFDFAIGVGVRRKRALARLLAAPMLLGLGLAPNSTESAAANGDTRTIVLCNSHTNESGSFTYMVDGVYDQAALERLNWFLRDWRLNETTKMDPKLFDIVWEVYRESGSTQPIEVLSGYRSPRTNALLRRRSRQVAKYSQHTEGKAVDAHFVDVETAKIRDIAMRMQAGGVGFYPSGATPWVHIDSGEVRYWPRMSRAALARIFPDGKTVFIPKDGQPMPGYELARAEIEARGGEASVAGAEPSKPGLLAWLFGDRGGGADDAEEVGGGEVPATGPWVKSGVHVAGGVPQVPPPTPQVVASGAPDSESDAAAVSPSDSAAEAFIAPLPPRKPAEIVAAQLAASDAPTPPPRPVEFAFAPLSAAAGDDEDLIAALIQHARLPEAIVLSVDRAPAQALALAEPSATPEPPDRSALLARAAALAAPPPLLPARLAAGRTAASAPPEDPLLAAGEITTATRTNAAAAAAAPRALALLSALQVRRNPPNPYGDLVYDAFPAATEPRAADGLVQLRGAEP